jgi:CheY-like chemotaxis protein
MVLVVEDVPILRLLAVTVVEDAGLHAIEASNADEAVQLLESRGDIRIVFTDIEMPGGSMNGAKLALCIRDRWPPIQLIVTSGHYGLEEVSIPAGALFFAKPYDPHAVSEAMRRMVN